MVFLRDEMVRTEMGYGHDGDDQDWLYNLGYTADDINIWLFGA